jgi:aryl-phospho-beta-D-glucosidase BglC (GH1 family)
MGIGWNLGNTLDSIDNKKRGILSELQSTTPETFYETYWGNPVTTAEMINAVADAGFGAIRIPVTYADHMDEDYQIRQEWLDRVEEVVNYVLASGIYCIINIHHDSGDGSWPWLKADLDRIGQMEEHLRTVWLQIAQHFIGYGDQLLFESFNEILDQDNHWGGADATAYHAVNRLNQVFVDTVRSTGSNNTTRFLIVKPYAASGSQGALDAFTLPADSAEHRLIVGVHYYGLAQFVWQQNVASWTKTYSDWDYLRDGKPVEVLLERLNHHFIENGVPVVVCEFGAHNKNNAIDRINYATHYKKTAKQYGIVCFWWDDGGLYEEASLIKNHTLFDRGRKQWFFPEIIEVMFASLKWS